MGLTKYFVCVVFLAAYASAIDTYYADQYCGQSIDMILEGVDQAKLVMDGSYTGDCNVTIESWYTADRLMFYFEDDFSMGSAILCVETYLTVYDGQYPDFDKVVHGLGRRCGDDKPSQENGFSSKSRYLTFRFFNTRPDKDTTVNIVFTAFHTGYCYSYEYRCDNGRCIDDDVNCNGYDSCGDQSDCTLSVAAIVGIVCGSVFVVCVCVAVFLVIRRGRRRSSPGQVIAPGQPYGGPAVVAGAANPNYASNYGTQYAPTYTAPIAQTSIQGK